MAFWLILLCDSHTVLEGLVHSLEHPTLGGVHIVGLAWRNGEERGIKGRHTAFQKVSESLPGLLHLTN